MSENKKVAVVSWAERMPDLASRGIDEATWEALKNTLYPSCKDESIRLAVDYCYARKLDIMMKPVHLVPMNVKNPVSGAWEWRDIPMPSIGLYRIQAERSGSYAGADAPEFGPEITRKFGSKEITFPEWCKYTVYKKISDRIVAYTALEYWEENYATAGKDKPEPNAMWSKRPRGQLAKCAEAQALRKAFPEVGQEATAEEMDGKGHEVKDVTSSSTERTVSRGAESVKAAIAGVIDDEVIDESQVKMLLRAADFIGEDINELLSKANITDIHCLPKARFEGAMNYFKRKGFGSQEAEVEIVI